MHALHVIYVIMVVGIWENMGWNLVALSMINGVLTLPLVFNYSIIPRIEKKPGQKLVYSKFYNYVWTGRYGRYLEISAYIVTSYLLYRFGKINNGRLEARFVRDFALYRANYPVEQFTAREIRWSFFAQISLLLFFGLGGLLYFLQP